MKYSFLNIAAAASATLAVATVALTLRSFSGDKWETLGPSSTTVLLYSGAFHYETHAYSSAHLVAINNGYAHLTEDRADGEFDAEIPISPWTHSSVPADQYKPGLENLGFEYISITSTTRSAPSTRKTSLTAAMASANTATASTGTINIDRKFLIIIPLWFPFLLFSALPIYAFRRQKKQLRRASRRERRRQAKILPTHCHACHAELIGLPYLCPHCGTPISSKSSPSSPPKSQILRPQ